MLTAHASVVLALAASPAADDASEFFERRVRPLLVERCQRCHGAERPKSKLRLDSRAAVLAGGERGPAAVEGKPAESRLVQAVRREGELAMPPKEPLPADEIAVLEEWIERGLPWLEDAPTTPAEHAAEAGGATPEREFTAEERSFWAFQPLADPAPPAVRDEEWARSGLDRFVLARLDSRGLAPAPPADRRVLIRRATFNLTGLPPTPAEVEAFLADDSDGAFAKVVDRLLASPRYGERWARHWLDVVRYADSFDARSLAAPNDPTDVVEAWRYRDWVVDALDSDLRWADFVRDQIAGDLRAEESGAFDRARVVATGMLAIGNWGGGDSDKEKLLTDIADDQVDVVSRAFLGLTVSCARCHDHKFDPITQADYYGLAGIFFSSRVLADVGPKTGGPPLLRIPLESREELSRRAAHDARMAELQAQVAAASGGALLATPVRDVAGIAGVLALRNRDDTPSMTVNTTDRPVAFLTLSLPPRCVSLHPSPSAGIAAIWSAPRAATLTVRGRVADGDSVCGDGVEWKLARAGATGEEVVASGAIENGASMELAAGSGGERLAALAVEAGDELRLTVLPRSGHVCDTTVIEWSLADAAGARTWSLTEDVLANAAGGALANPLPAAEGAAWRFVDRAGAGLDDAQLAALSADPARRASIEASLAELAALRERAPPPLSFANGVAEGGVPRTPHEGVHDVAIHVRGRYDRLGPVVPRRLPRILAGDAQPPIESGSGRRELAEWLARPGHPLVARVAVNRVWQRHFGAGLVRGGNFGRLGEPPSHPELLDWLARRFVEGGGSLKALHREILLSSTWQQSSVTSPGTLAADPENRLLGRMPRVRLDAEQIRDAMLLASGELELARGGPAVRDPASPRRALYLMTVRSDRSGFRPLFDAADPTAVVDQRAETLVAPQALWLLNSGFVLDRAAALARRVCAEAGGDAARIAALFERLLARPPDDDERAIAAGRLERARAAAAAGFDPAAPFEELAHVLLASNEFLFVD